MGGIILLLLYPQMRGTLAHPYVCSSLLPPKVSQMTINNNNRNYTRNITYIAISIQ